MACCYVRDCDNTRARQVKINNNKFTNTYNFSVKTCYNKKRKNYEVRFTFKFIGLQVVCSPSGFLLKNVSISPRVPHAPTSHPPLI